MVRVHAAALFLEGVQTLGRSSLGSKIEFCNFLTERAKSQKERSLALSRITRALLPRTRAKQGKILSGQDDT